MRGTTKAPSLKRASRPHTPATSEAARKVGLAIEEERRKIGELAFAELSSPQVIRRIQKLEQLINEHFLITWANKDRSFDRRR